MTKRISLLAVAAAFSFVSTAQAQVPPAVLQNQNRIQLEQQRLMNEEFRRQELKNALKRPQAQETEKKSQEKEPDLVTSCVNVKEIEFSGNTKFSKCEINKAIAQYQNTCMGLPQINEMLNKITDMYIEKGDC